MCPKLGAFSICYNIYQYFWMAQYFTRSRNFRFDLKISLVFEDLILHKWKSVRWRGGPVDKTPWWLVWAHHPPPPCRPIQNIFLVSRNGKKPFLLICNVSGLMALNWSGREGNTDNTGRRRRGNLLKTRDRRKSETRLSLIISVSPLSILYQLPQLPTRSSTP